MEYISLLQRFLVAIALGALIGLEREYARYRKRGHDYAGIRTFPLIALFGALSAYLAETLLPLILVASTLLMGGLIVISYFLVNAKSRRYHGATSEVAGFLAFFIGILSYYGELKLAVALTVTITIILYSRSVLHRFAERLKRHELAGTLKFAVIAFVILPFLPNKGYGPSEIFNPFLIWLMVVFISGISFAGYILMKWFGQKGIVLTANLGGLASSTAETSSFAERSRKEKKGYRALALGVILANGMIFIKILLEVFVLNQALFVQVLLPMAILAAVTAVFSYALWKKAQNVEAKIELKSPFTLAPALKFGVLFAVILAVVKMAELYLSSNGIYIVSFLSGLADVDVLTVSLAQLANNGLEQSLARNGIIIAAVTNIAVKGGIALFFGGKQFGRLVLSFFLALIGIGLVTLLL